MIADRIRHIKCDEAKPSCLKCTSTGRICDGYELRASIETTNEAARAQVVPRYPISVVVNPSLGIPGTHEESELFEKFYYSSGHRISVVLNSKLVYQLVLQTYHSDKAVRSIVIAITALITGYQAEAANGLPTQPASQFTLRHYHKGLQWLQKLIADDPGRPTELTIISSLLLAIFEFLRCHWTNSYMHFHSGLKILKRETSPSRGLSPLKEEIHRSFSGIDRRAALWYYIEPGKLHQRPQIWRHCCNTPPTGDSQSSIYEAAMSLNALTGSLYQVWNSIFHDGSSGSIFQIKGRLEVEPDAIYTQLDDLAGAMDTIVAKLSDGVSRDMIHLTAALTIDEILALLMFDLASPKPEFSEDKIKKHMFLLILKLAESIIRSGSVKGVVANLRGKLSNIASGEAPIRSGVIFPPESTAVECKDLELRQTAISLLSRRPWGVPSDSATVAREIEGKSS